MYSINTGRNGSVVQWPHPERVCNRRRVLSENGNDLDALHLDTELLDLEIELADINNYEGDDAEIDIFAQDDLLAFDDVDEDYFDELFIDGFEVAERHLTERVISKMLPSHTGRIDLDLIIDLQDSETN